MAFQASRYTAVSFSPMARHLVGVMICCVAGGAVVLGVGVRGCMWFVCVWLYVCVCGCMWVYVSVCVWGELVVTSHTHTFNTSS